MPNPFYNCRIIRIKATEATVVMRIPFDCLKLFQIDKYALKPRMNPWADKEYLAWLYNAYPELLNSAGYKFKDLLIHKLEVSVVDKGVLLA
jgi:hypothetical protein